MDENEMNRISSTLWLKELKWWLRSKYFCNLMLHVFDDDDDVFWEKKIPNRIIKINSSYLFDARAKLVPMPLWFWDFDVVCYFLATKKLSKSKLSSIWLAHFSLWLFWLFSNVLDFGSTFVRALWKVLLNRGSELVVFSILWHLCHF